MLNLYKNFSTYIGNKMSKKLEEAVTKALKGAKLDDKGKTVYPEGTDEDVIYIANIEKRRRDTQASFVKEQQRANSLETENGKLVETWESEMSKNLTQTQRDELEELKNTDAEAWREKLNTYEAANKADVKVKSKKIKEDSHKESELQRRERVLKEYNEKNPEHQLTDDVIDNDLPPRMAKKLAKGEITFDEFITEANVYLGKGKVVGGGDDEVDGDPDLSDAGGSSTPASDAVDKDATASYDKEVY